MMEENSNLVSVFMGTEPSVILLKGKLEMSGISSEIRKDSTAGYWGVVPDNIELFIEKKDLKEAEPVIEDFIKSRKVEKI
jgi:hypothetical protein